MTLTLALTCEEEVWQLWEVSELDFGREISWGILEWGLGTKNRTHDTPESNCHTKAPEMHLGAAVNTPATLVDLPRGAPLGLGWPLDSASQNWATYPLALPQSSLEQMTETQLKFRTLLD